MSVGRNVGWGTCAGYLRQELSKIIDIVDVPRYAGTVQHIDGTVLHTIKGGDFETELPVWGDTNIGYCFIEYPMTQIGLERARKFDLLFAGSNWCKRLLTEQYGLPRVETLVQGVDTNLFKPVRQFAVRDTFRIFSGGKFEHRKGQDVVLIAFRRLQKKYRDLELVTCWWNPWPSSMDSMEWSKHIRFARPKGEEINWEYFMAGLMQLNGLFPARMTHHDMIHHEKLPGVMLGTDIGLFPNRCEGGTNLMMMEYMACGLPIIATDGTGHADILNTENSMHLKLSDAVYVEGTIPNDRVEWLDPNIDEVVDYIEWAYNNRDNLADYGHAAAKTIQEQFTWEHAAERLVTTIEEHLGKTPAYFQIADRGEFPKLWNSLGLLGNGCEIGVQKGEFSAYIRQEWHGARLHLVDRWMYVAGWDDSANVDQASQDALYRQVVIKFINDPTIEIHRMSSLDAAKLFSDGYFDWIFHDADHTYHAMKNDLVAWWPKLRVGGMYCGHDFIDGKFTSGSFGVFSAVTEFAKRIGAEIYTTKEPIVAPNTLGEDGNPVGQVLRSWYFLKG